MAEKPSRLFFHSPTDVLIKVQVTILRKQTQNEILMTITGLDGMKRAARKVEVNDMFSNYSILSCLMSASA